MIIQAATELAPPCTICHEAMIKDVTKCNPCGHNYHTPCLTRWIERESRGPTRDCPMCRQEITGEQRCTKEVSSIIVKELGAEVFTGIITAKLEKWREELRVKAVEIESESEAILLQLQANTKARQQNNFLLNSMSSEIGNRERKERAERAEKARKECDRLRQGGDRRKSPKSPFAASRSPKKPYRLRSGTNEEGERNSTPKHQARANLQIPEKPPILDLPSIEPRPEDHGPATT